MLNFHLEATAAIAPGLSSDESWQHWFKSPTTDVTYQDELNIQQIPPMLRRRFKQLGRTASVAALDILNQDDAIPSIFASRHGDTELTLSLLQDIAINEPVSPAGFSLAVHNAVGGLLSIARKDKSPMTALSCHEDLVINTLFELHAQLKQYERVLCVIYDIPLPAFYQPYATSLPFPMAIAFIASRAENNVMLSVTQNKTATDTDMLEDDIDMLAFIKLMSGTTNEIMCYANKQQWRLTRQESNHAC